MGRAGRVTRRVRSDRFRRRAGAPWRRSVVIPTLASVGGATVSVYSPPRSPRRDVSTQPRRATAFVESLEGRVFLHTGPLQVAGVVADNRGEMIITMNQAIRPSNVNTGSIQMYTAGADGVLAT